MEEEKENLPAPRAAEVQGFPLMNLFDPQAAHGKAAEMAGARGGLPPRLIGAGSLQSVGEERVR
ncbi:MAG TPA: hypothetical protein VEH09_06220 [Thermodesulfobacteriota bacterium]|nr:hypothetical protein [Thermodesulfobacteriota bacterium]